MLGYFYVKSERILTNHTPTFVHQKSTRKGTSTLKSTEDVWMEMLCMQSIAWKQDKLYNKCKSNFIHMNIYHTNISQVYHPNCCNPILMQKDVTSKRVARILCMYVTTWVLSSQLGLATVSAIDQLYWSPGHKNMGCGIPSWITSPWGVSPSPWSVRNEVSFQP